MSDIPKFNPNNIVKRAYLKDINSSNLTEQSTDGETPKYDASKIVKKGYAPRECIPQKHCIHNMWLVKPTNMN
jgi:hypothetical protein